MATTNNLRKTLNLKTWELAGFNTLSVNTQGGFVCGEYSPYFPDNDLYFAVNSSTSVQRYNAAENGFQALSASLGGTFGAGACGETMHYGAPGGVQLLTATGGTTTTINTTINMAQNAVGSKIKIIEGPNAGTEYTIAWNTIGPNSVITLVETAPLAFTTATKFMLITGSLWVLIPSSTAATFWVYDIVTNAWTSLRSVSTWGTEGKLIKAHKPTDNFATGSVTAATTTTITVTGLTGIGYNWTNYEVEIIGGTGKGQYRNISAGTTSTLTVTTAWTITPDATSTYVIKGNRTALYLVGNGAVATYRYDTSANTWTTLTPVIARGGVMSTGGTADLIRSAPEWVTPHVTTGKAGGQNGRYIYSFRGNTTVVMDVYDIAANTWLNDLVYGNRGESLAPGSCAVADGRYIYYTISNTHRFYRYDIVTNKSTGIGYLLYPMGTATNGNRMFITKYVDNGTTLTWLHYIIESSMLNYRMLII